MIVQVILLAAAVRFQGYVKFTIEAISEAVCEYHMMSEIKYP